MGIGQEGAATTSAAEARRPAASGTDAEERGSSVERTGPGRAQDQSAANRLEQAQEELSDRQQTTISLLRNVRYHEDRQGFFTLVNRVMNFAVLMSGTAVVTTLAHADHPGPTATAFAMFTTVIGAVQLVFDTSQKQFLHDSLRARFLDLLSDLTEANVADIRSRAAKLYSSEPPTYYAVDALAYNAAQKALERPDATLKVVGLWRTWLRHLIRYTSTTFKPAKPTIPVG